MATRRTTEENGQLEQSTPSTPHRPPALGRLFRQPVEGSDESRLIYRAATGEQTVLMVGRDLKARLMRAVEQLPLEEQHFISLQYSKRMPLVDIAVTLNKNSQPQDELDSQCGPEENDRQAQQQQQQGDGPAEMLLATVRLEQTTIRHLQQLLEEDR